MKMPEAKTSKFAIIILATICITYIVENFLRSAAGALTPVLMDELGVSYGAMGLLTTAFFLTYGLMQIPSGILSDTIGPRKTIIWSTAVTVVGVVLFWVHKTYPMLFVAQFLVGIGSSTFYINAVKLMLDWFPPSKKATAVGVMSAASGIGNTMAYIGFPMIVGMVGGWRSFYISMGAILLGNWVMNLFLLKDRAPPKIAGVFNAREILDSVIGVIKNPLMRPYIIAYSLRSTNFVFGIWMTQFLIDAKGFTYLQSGQITSIGTLAAIPGCIVVAAISDRMMNRKKPLLFFGYSTFIAMAVFMFLPASMPMWVFAGVNAAIYIAVGYWVLFFSMVPEILRSEETGIGLGVINAVCTLGISLLSPVYGALVDSTGSYFTSNMLMLVGAFLVPLLMTNVDESYGGVKKKLAALQVIR
jgi:MFS family permease